MRSRQYKVFVGLGAIKRRDIHWPQTGDWASAAAGAKANTREEVRMLRGLQLGWKRGALSLRMGLERANRQPEGGAPGPWFICRSRMLFPRQTAQVGRSNTARWGPEQQTKPRVREQGLLMDGRLPFSLPPSEHVFFWPLGLWSCPKVRPPTG